MAGRKVHSIPPSLVALSDPSFETCHSLPGIKCVGSTSAWDHLLHLIASNWSNIAIQTPPPSCVLFKGHTTVVTRHRLTEAQDVEAALVAFIHTTPLLDMVQGSAGRSCGFIHRRAHWTKQYWKIVSMNPLRWPSGSMGRVSFDSFPLNVERDVCKKPDFKSYTITQLPSIWIGSLWLDPGISFEAPPILDHLVPVGPIDCYTWWRDTSLRKTTPI